MTWNPLHTRQVSTNVRRYLSDATLPTIKLATSAPPMPPERHKSHRNILSVRPERYRKLEQMYRLNPEVFNEEVTSFIKFIVPLGPLDVDDIDPETGDSISLPCKGYDIASASPAALRHIEELGTLWLEHYALRTAQRLLAMLPALAASKNWSFNRPDDIPDLDHSIFRYFMWNKCDDSSCPSGPSDPCNLVIAYQPPWILSPHDMKQFTKTFYLPMYTDREGSSPVQFNSAQRVWAKIWDTCKQRDCPWFILTNYSNWVFGCFSQGWTRAFVSDMKDASSKDPTVLQCLLFWLVSSMKLDFDRIFQRPKVPELVELDLPLPFVPQNENSFANTTSIAPSESFWSGQSEEPASSAGVSLEDGPPLSPLRSKVPWSFGVGARSPSTDHVSSWLARTGHPDPLPPPLIPERQSPAPSDWSIPSVATIRGKSGGGYLNIIPPANEDCRFR